MAALNHELRAKGIGSSEIAMLVMGEDGKPLSPWGGPHKLWRRKTGQELPEDTEDKPWLERGRFLEPAILAWYAHRSGNKLRTQPGTRQDTKLPVLVDTADALAWRPGEDRPCKTVEAKTASPWHRHLWGEDGTDQVPRYYLIQGQWHMGAWRLPECDYPVYWGEDLRIYTTKHDEELLLALASIAEKFWHDHVVSGVAPPVDGLPSTSEWLSKRLAKKNDDLVAAEGDTLQMMLRFREVRRQADELEAEADLLANELKVSIGERSGLFVPGSPRLKVTFNLVKGRSYVDHEAIVRELLEERGRLLEELSKTGLGLDGRTPLTFEELQSRHTKQAESYRRFLPTGLIKGDLP